MRIARHFYQGVSEESLWRRQKAEEQIAECFKSGHGMGWHEHHPELFIGTERFFRPGYSANLISSWIPVLEGMKDKIGKGAIVTDVGCGLGASTVLMAKSYPKSKFFGFGLPRQIH